MYVWVAGDLDISTAPQLAAELRSAQETGLEVTVDLAYVDFMDCAGLRTLVTANAEAPPGRFSLTPGPPQVQKLFELFGIDGVLEVLARPVNVRRDAA